MPENKEIGAESVENGDFVRKSEVIENVAKKTHSQTIKKLEEGEEASFLEKIEEMDFERKVIAVIDVINFVNEFRSFSKKEGGMYTYMAHSRREAFKTYTPDEQQEIINLHNKLYKHPDPEWLGHILHDGNNLRTYIVEGEKEKYPENYQRIVPKVAKLIEDINLLEPELNRAYQLLQRCR